MTQSSHEAVGSREGSTERHGADATRDAMIRLHGVEKTYGDGTTAVGVPSSSRAPTSITVAGTGAERAAAARGGLLQPAPLGLMRLDVRVEVHRRRV